MLIFLDNTVENELKYQKQINGGENVWDNIMKY